MKILLVCLVCLAAGYAIGYWQFGDRHSTPSSASSSPGVFAQFEALQNSRHNASEQEETPSTGGEEVRANIRDQLERVREIEGISYTDFAQLALSPTVEKVEEIIDDMSPGDLSLAINSLTGLDKEEIQELEDMHGFSKSLVKVVLRNTTEEAHQDVTTIDFGTDTNSSNKVVTAMDLFPSSTDRIYASFALKGKPHEKIMVKWFRNAPYALQILNRYRINPSKEYNYVWFKPSNWEPGLYSVEVFAMNSELTLLASGSFEIAS